MKITIEGAGWEIAGLLRELYAWETEGTAEISAELPAEAETPPRVMTPEEIEAAPAGSVLWVESYFPQDCLGTGHPKKNETELAPMEKQEDGKLHSYGVLLYAEDFSGEADEFGARMRCWSGRPGEEQRRKTAW